MGMRSIAHLNALRAFEASARHQSFSLAAQELNVTPAAVGQLVRTLEDWLGSPLFVRSTSGRARLVTTEVAEQALPDIRAGLERLAVGLERLRSGSAGGVLTVTVSPAFAAKWLLPRIERFQAAWPETDLRLDTSLKPVDFVAQRIDVGVRYGRGQWPGLAAEKLMDEEVYPCAPRRCWPRQRCRPRAICAGRCSSMTSPSIPARVLPAGRPGCAMRGCRGCPPIGACASTTRPPCCRRPLMARA